jgi:tetratricopeptide (TPR) repeat protein
VTSHPARKPRHPAPEPVDLPSVEPSAEELVQEGLRTLDRRDCEEAADLFRKALAKAPFRTDVKELLALALQGRTHGGQKGALAGLKASRRRAVAEGSMGDMRRQRRRVGGMRWARWSIALSTVGALGLAAWGFLSWDAGPDPREARPVESAEVVQMLARAQIYQEDGRYQEAIETLDEVLRRQPADPGHIRASQAEIYYKQGIVLFEKRDYSPAIGLLAKAAQLVKDKKEYQYELGWALHLRGRNLAAADADQAREYEQRACAAFEAALAVDPDHLLALNGLARTLLALGDKEGAAAPLRRIVEIAPKSLEAGAALKELEKLGLLEPAVEAVPTPG